MLRAYSCIWSQCINGDDSVSLVRRHHRHRHFIFSALQGQLYVAAIYDKLYLGDSRVRLGLSAADFSDELERQLAAGRVLSYVQAYEQRGLVRFSAVWTPKTSRHWAASHAMSKYTVLNKLVDYAAVNVPLVSVAAYVDDDGGLYFAALWR